MNTNRMIPIDSGPYIGMYRVEVLLVEWQKCVSVNLCTRVRTIFEGLFTEIYSASCFWRDMDFGALRTENRFLRGTLEDPGVIAKRVDNRECHLKTIRPMRDRTPGTRH